MINYYVEFADKSGKFHRLTCEVITFDEAYEVAAKFGRDYQCCTRVVCVTTSIEVCLEKGELP